MKKVRKLLKLADEIKKEFEEKREKLEKVIVTIEKEHPTSDTMTEEQLTNYWKLSEESAELFNKIDILESLDDLLEL